MLCGQRNWRNADKSAPPVLFPSAVFLLAASLNSTLLHGPQCNYRTQQLSLFLRRVRVVHFATLTDLLHAVPQVITAATVKYCLTRRTLGRKSSQLRIIQQATTTFCTVLPFYTSSHSHDTIHGCFSSPSLSTPS